MDAMAQFEACRICANLYVSDTEMDFVNLFQPMEGIQRELEFILAELKTWQLKICPNDGLPQRICANCFTKFCSIDVFRQEVDQAQQKLLESYAHECNMVQAAQDGEIMQETIVPDSIDNYITTEVPITPKVVVSLQEAQQLQLNADQNYAVYGDDLTNFPNGTVLGANTELIANTLMNVTPTNGADALQFVTEESAQNIYFEPQIQEVAFAKEADCIVQSKSFEAEMENIVSQDLEEMLQGSIIPKRISETSENITVDDNENRGTGGLDIKHDDEDYENFSDSDCNEIDDSTDRLAGNPFACQYCYCRPTGPIDHVIFPDSDALSQHFFDVHDPNLPYTCPYCSMTYKSPKPRDNHVRQVHAAALRKEQQCPYCHKTLRSPVHVHQYNCTFVGDWECEDCGEKFPQTPLFRFRTHQRQHDPSKQFRCSVCERSFVRRANLEAHERLHVKESDTFLTCDECQATFSGEYELKRHKYQAHDGDLPVKCDYCYKGFVSKAFLNRHLQHFHPEKLDANNADAVTCNNCGTTFSSLHKLRFHQQRPRDENGKCIINVEHMREKRRQQRQGIFPCPFCSKRFHLKVQMEKHLNTHDARLRPFQCDQCHIRCRTPFELKQHVNVAHLHIKAFECETCGKRFGYKKDLRDHMLFHAELTVSCTEEGCDYICKNDKALNDHIRHKHRPIPCEYCSQTFSRQRLTTHLRNVHRAEIDIETAEEAQLAIAAMNGGEEKVRVEMLHSEPTNTLALQADLHNSYKPLGDVPETQIEEFFLGSLLDPEHEIIVT